MGRHVPEERRKREASRIGRLPNVAAERLGAFVNAPVATLHSRVTARTMLMSWISAAAARVIPRIPRSIRCASVDAQPPTQQMTPVERYDLVWVPRKSSLLGLPIGCLGRRSRLEFGVNRITSQLCGLECDSNALAICLDHTPNLLKLVAAEREVAELDDGRNDDSSALAKSQYVSSRALVAWPCSE